MRQSDPCFCPQPLAGSHSGSQQQVAGFALDLRTRVALVSRSISLTAAAEWPQPYVVALSPAEAAQPASLVRLSNVRIEGIPRVRLALAAAHS